MKYLPAQPVTVTPSDFFSGLLGKFLVTFFSHVMYISMNLHLLKTDLIEGRNRMS